jgi:hypothetical protein
MSVGKCLVAMFAWLLGFGATCAEPALNTLGMTVEKLTKGKFKRSMLIGAVSLGVATGAHRATIPPRARFAHCLVL